MNAKTETSASALDKLILLVAAAILVGGVVGYYYLAEYSQPLRLGGIILTTVAALFTGFQTHPGKELWRFIQGSRVEIRKVIWPNRQETMQTTVQVLIFAVIMGVFFWGLDKVLLLLTKTLSGQGV